MAGLTMSNQILEKIQSFFNESGYNDITKNTAKYNMSIRKDRVYRQPYIDGQTGIAQRHCHLFLSDKQRMPGILQGQVYTYPARRWKSAHRSYLTNYLQTPREEPEEHTITTVENPAILTGSVATVPEEIVPIEKSKPIIKPSSYKGGLNTSTHSFVPDSMESWAFYEENTFEEDLIDEFESEEDFEDETYSRKGSKRRKPPGRKPKEPKHGKPKKKSLKAPARLIRSIKKDENDTENKPYVCEYRNRRGPAVGPMSMGNNPMIPASVPLASGASHSEGEINGGKKRVPPSPYCDFCLGDSTENKKTGQSEDLVSCADCGRSGHPSCLQFTDNMMKSVLRYRWQCIECKTCTLCGTSENDDQLLFCDDCDRGYHLYCLNPPLSEPPEGEWSCNLCIKEFH